MLHKQFRVDFFPGIGTLFLSKLHQTCQEPGQEKKQQHQSSLKFGHIVQTALELLALEAGRRSAVGRAPDS